MQTAYEIRVATDSNTLIWGNKNVWNSGKVYSEQSLYVVYHGPALFSNKKYWWQLRIWDNHGRTSKWSATAYWHMGLLKIQDWKAAWIEAPVHEEGAIRPAHLFQKTFMATKKVVLATAYITAHGVYEATLNNKRCGDVYLAPGWTTYKKRLQYQAYDISDIVRKGSNELTVSVGSGWYRTSLSWSPQRSADTPRLGLLAQLHIQYEDGSKVVIATDETWKWTSNGPIRNSEIYDGEVYDAQLQWPGSKTRSWAFVKVVPYQLDNLVATESEGVKKGDVLPTVAIIKTPKGETVLDFGQNLVGWAQLRLKGDKGDTVNVFHAEVLDRNGNFYTENLRGARQQNQYILDGISRVYEPHFTFQGFRYIKLEGYRGVVRKEDVTAVALYSATRQTGTFSCSNSLVNRLQQNIEWSQKGNFLDIPTDCPQRDERLGWTGDAQVFARTAGFNRNVYAFFSKWLKDLSAEQLPTGAVPAVVPNVFGNYVAGSSGWGDVATFLPWDMYQLYGDQKILETQYASMKAWVGYIEKQSTDNLWQSGFHFGDWLYFRSADDWENETATTNKYLIAQCFWARSTQLMIHAATVLGKQDDVAHYNTQLQKIKTAFIREYISPNGRFVSSTQTAYLLALQFDLLPEAQRKSVAKKLADDVVARNYHLSTGFLGTPYLCHVLSRFGYNSIAYKLLLQETYPSWLYPVKMGATTIWERWDGIKTDGTFQGFMMNSFNHYSYGAVGDWMYRTVAGIDLLEPGYKKIKLQPQPDTSLQSASATFESPYGEIRCGWKRQGQTIVVNATVPPNTTAEIRLPAALSGIKNNDVLKKRLDPDGTTVLTLGSGSYEIAYPEKARRN
jgi:alpha-L-rhamnosidase